MTAEPWIVRGFERQELHSQLNKLVFEELDRLKEEGDPLGDVFLQEMVLVIMAQIEHCHCNKPPCLATSTVDLFVSKRILPKITGFARVDEEKKSLLADLLIWLVETMCCKHKARLNRLEIIYPDKVFMGPSS
ncbi:MAG: hypothetical protein WC763_00385 [Candidatus Paceibacterota bacterium]|jgi:hypothetical protein